MWNSLRRLGVAPGDVEDVAHEVFLAVFRHLDDYDPSRPLRPWLFGFTFRTAYRYRDLARHKLERATDALDPADERPGAEEQLASFQARQVFARALATVELDRRAVFIMHDIDECPMPEIATALSIPLNTAYSRLRLARKDLKKTLTRLRARQEDQ